VYTESVVTNAGRLGCDAAAVQFVGKKEEHDDVRYRKCRQKNRNNTQENGDNARKTQNLSMSCVGTVWSLRSFFMDLYR
jgi:hypothetical protein